MCFANTRCPSRRDDETRQKFAMSDDAMPPPAKKPRPAMMRKRSSVLAAERAGITAHVDAAPPPPAEDDANAAAKAMFSAHDADGNGVLDHAEFRALLLSLGRECNRLHPRYVEHFLRVTDTAPHRRSVPRMVTRVPR